MNLYCKCGNKIERLKKGQILQHRGEDICEECRKIVATERYKHYKNYNKEKTEEDD